MILHRSKNKNKHIITNQQSTFNGMKKKGPISKRCSYLFVIIAFLSFKQIYDGHRIRTIHGLKSSMTQESSSPIAMVSMYGQHRYQPSFDSLPKWLQDYFTWHRKQTSSQPDTKYAVLTCLPEDKCGGLSDRLRALPFYLFVGKYTNRVVCIYWKKGFGLEEFLQPVHFDSDIGIEWRCPDEVNQYYDLKRSSGSQKKVPFVTLANPRCSGRSASVAPCVEGDIKMMNDDRDEKYVTIGLYQNSYTAINTVNLLTQRHSYGGDYNKHNNSNNLLMPNIYAWQYPEMMGDIFRVMFEPIPSLAQRINETMTNLGLVENEFISVHTRTRYPVDTLKRITAHPEYDKNGGLVFDGEVKEYFISLIQNALNCAHSVAPNPDLKFFFVSDNHDATNYAISNDFNVGEKGHQVNVRPIGINRLEEPLHIDKHHKSNVADLFPIFEDLLLMGGSRCVAHGIGSFGSFGAGLIGNRCRAIHRDYRGRPIECPNERTVPSPVVINATEMMFGENPGGEGLLIYDENRYVKMSN
jgi:hypothetical protein